MYARVMVMMFYVLVSILSIALNGLVIILWLRFLCTLTLSMSTLFSIITDSNLCKRNLPTSL